MKDNKQPHPDAGFRIEKVHAFLHIDQNDVEGVVGFMDQSGVFWPMVSADPARLASLRPIAERIATGQRIPIVLAEFSVRKDVEIIEP